MPDNPPAARSACVGDHHYAHHVRGGEPLSIPICTLCGEIGWDDIREQIATAVLPAHRAMVLGEAADTLIAADLGPSRDPGWMFADDPVALVRRLATSPPTGPASTPPGQTGVPLAEVLEALRDHDGFRAWALATDRTGYLDEYTPNDDVIGDFLAERFQPTADTA